MNIWKRFRKWAFACETPGCSGNAFIFGDCIECATKKLNDAEKAESKEPPIVEILYAVRDAIDALVRVASEVLDPQDARVSRAWDALEKINKAIHECEKP